MSVAACHSIIEATTRADAATSSASHNTSCEMGRSRLSLYVCSSLRNLDICATRAFALQSTAMDGSRTPRLRNCENVHTTPAWTMVANDFPTYDACATSLV